MRRSSSKRKDKENGVSGGSAAKISASSGSLDKGSSGALTPQATAATAVAASGTPVTETGAIHHAGDSGVGHDNDFLRLSTELSSSVLKTLKEMLQVIFAPSQWLLLNYYSIPASIWE